MSTEWLNELPDKERSIAVKLMDAQWPGGEALLREVQSYLGHLRELHRQDETLDLTTAEQLSLGCTKLIRRLGSDAPFSACQAVMVAARYFVLENDASDDAASCLGLDDDVEVFNAVAKRLGHTDLTIAII